MLPFLYYEQMIFLSWPLGGKGCMFHWVEDIKNMKKNVFDNLMSWCLHLELHRAPAGNGSFEIPNLPVQSICKMQL